LKIHNANALSSPYTVGFPAVTAWLGAVHAMQRQLNADDEYKDVKFNATGIVCHKMNLQTHRGVTQKGYKQEFDNIISTANPIKKDGTRPSTIPEIRCHLTVSLVIEYKGSFGGEDEQTKTKKLQDILHRMKFAGGDLISTNHKISFCDINNNEEYVKDFNKLRHSLTGGWWLIERNDLMAKAMNDGQDALNALLDYLKISHTCTEEENGKGKWTSKRKEPGWIVPIAIGFQGLTSLGKLRNQRDNDYQHCFAEAIVTLGQFKLLFSDDKLDQMLWRTHYDKDKNQYLCKQVKPTNFEEN
jgi:CRISPR-associated protein Csy2